ncbi:N-acyl-D-glutamate deacylase/dihydroorotase [Algoriphagus boseongensis]|uniref:N-acyl-D-glutamate deacylase/dihydroorotase n=1 Tax=Algoriphagus boseongensis TaxID=1442587 RepID=A0A4R6T9U9_9BACT|nr:amidohydrolase family protein [Algoriphagus boseongensis]TDQ19019.1 N-acyl-D-glutamate deacylase/dihydroorotase [Algoriphagus boseongensis]
MKKSLLTLFISALFFSSCNETSTEKGADPNQEFDIVILNGRVMDPETNFDGIRNVGIKDGIISLITEDEIKGKETIDATGQVVAPGFIDGHQHCIEPYMYNLMLRDGRTTIMDLEVGAYGPKLDEWYKRHEGNTPLNYGVAVAHELARAAVLDGFNEWEFLYTMDALKTRVKDGWSKTRPNLEQGNEILAQIDEGLRQGGIGIGSTVGYMREGVSTREIYELQKLAGAYGRQIGMHFRGTPGDDVAEVNGIQEMLANAAALGAPAIAIHFNNPGYNLVHELLVKMRERGFNVWGEIYPYAAGSTALNAVFLEPDVWIKSLGNKYEETVQDVATGEWYTQESREEMLKKEPTRAVIVYKMPKEAIVDWLKMPGVAIGSDGMPLIPFTGLTRNTPYEDLPNVHPRSSGAFAKTLRFGQDNNIPLMQLVSMTSYNYAKPLGDMGLKAMQVRGRMQEGMVADITIFSPENVKDNATYEKGTTPSTGIPYVLVNGVIVVKDSKVMPDTVNPGQPIRFEPVAESKRVPIDVEGWQKEFYAVPREFDGVGLK